MAELDLQKYGITGATEVVHNPSYEQLFADETDPKLEGYEKGQVTEMGAVNVMTGVTLAVHQRTSSSYSTMLPKTPFGGLLMLTRMTTSLFLRLVGRNLRSLLARN